MKDDDRSITLTINLPKNMGDINTLTELCLAFTQRCLEAIIQSLDDELLKKRPKGWRCVGKRWRTISTRVGDIRIHRRLYVKATKSKKQRGRFLLDEKLNIQPQRRVTHGLLKLMVAAAARLPFREVAKMLEEAGFPAVSHTTIHKEVRHYGLLQKKELEQMRDILFLAGKETGEEGKKKRLPILFLEADGVMIKCQGAKEKKFELKMGVVYEGWEKVGAGRKLKNPRVMVGLFANGATFWETFTAALAKIYDLEDTLIIINGDGASWIQDTAKEYFPRSIVQIDRFHLARDLRLAMGKPAADRLLEILKKGKLKVFIDTLVSMEPCIPGEKMKIYKKLCNFSQKYPEHLLDYRRRIGYEYKGIRLYGMGIAETMVDKKVANRMKKRGMRWSKEGAMAMAGLLMLKGNGQIFTWLDAHTEEDIQNPVKKWRNIIKNKVTVDPESPLRAKMPVLNTGEPWVQVLREISRIPFTA